MRRFLERSLLSSRASLFLINLLTLVIVGLAVYHTTNQLVKTIQQEIQAQQTVEALQQTLILVTDAETGQRGYGFTREERFLDPYYGAIAELDSTLNTLQTQLTDPKQQTNFKQLQRLIQQRLALLQAAIDLQRKTLDLNTQIQLSDRGKGIHDQIRQAIAHMKEQEKSRLQQLSAESQNWSHFAILSLLAGMGLSLLLFTLTYSLLNQQIEANQQSKAALARHEEQLRMALEAARMGLWDWNLETGEIIWSKEHAEIFGLAPGDFDGRYETFDALLHPDDREALNQAVAHAINNQVSYYHEYRIIWPDGRIHWVEGRGRAFYNKAGQPVRMAGTMIAIDQRKQTELALQTLNAELEQRVASRTAELHQINESLIHEIQIRQQIEASLQQTIAEVTDLYNNAPCGYHSLDGNGLFIQINDTELQWLGYTREEILYQKKFSDLLTPESAKAFQKNFLIFKQQGYINNLEYQISRKDGSVFDISINAIAICDEQGNIVMNRATMINISDRKQIEAEQQRIARMKDEFVSVVSHELRTPLTAVYGALNLLAENLVPANSDQGQRVVQIAAGNAERLVNLVNDILDLERLESGKISLHKQSCNAATLLTSAANLNQLLANRNGITLQVSANNDVEIRVDRDRILQVLTNLLSNAIKFSPSGSTVLLKAEVRKAEVRDDEISPSHPPTLTTPPSPTVYLLFSINDQGRGIPVDKLESIFERFQQVDASDARKSGGTGLGLAISRSIVQQHGGEIWAESTVGQGSTFYFTIPL